MNRLARLIVVSVSLMGAYVYARQFMTRDPAVTFATRASATAWMPLHVLPSGLIVVDGRIAGGVVPLLLDTAASATLVDAATATRLALPLGSAVTVTGTTGNTVARFAAGVTIEIGAMRLGPMRVVVMDLSDLAERLHRPVSVVLGRDLFDRTVVELDYSQSKARFHDKASVLDPGTASVVPLKTNAGKYQLEAAIEDLPASPVHLDTGSSENLTVFKAYAESHALLKARTPVSTRLSGGVVGSAVSRLASLRTFTIGGMVLRNVPAAFDQAATGAFASRTSSGNLGSGVLRRFLVTIDVPHERLILTPQPGWDAAFQRDRVGLQAIYRDGALDVVHVAEGSPAAADGWRTGDQITAINAQTVTESMVPMWRSLTAGATGSTLTLRDRHGRERTIVLRDYY